MLCLRKQLVHACSLSHIKKYIQSILSRFLSFQLRYLRYLSNLIQYCSCKTGGVMQYGYDIPALKPLENTQREDCQTWNPT